MDTDTGQHDDDAVQGPDLEYDLAHESQPLQGAGPAGDDRPPAPVYVVTETEGYDGDYGYDLAHDVPRRR